MLFSRREFLGGLAAASALSALPRSGFAMNFESPVPASCPFRLSVINDEISQDFDHACSVAAGDFGLHWIELRGMWNKNVTDLDANQLDRSQAHPEEIRPARHRYCQPALQGRLAGRAA